MRYLLVTMLVLSLAGCATMRNGTALKEGEHVVFFGDSITQQGARPDGYVSQVRDSLSRAYPGLGITVTGAGISGNKVGDLLARLDRDVISKKPTTVVVYIGINDVWHWDLPNHKGTTPQEFETGISSLIDQLQAAHARVILCTPTVIGEKATGTNKLDAELDRYSEISRKVARAKKVQILDLRRAFTDRLSAINTANVEKGVLTTDGVHLNLTGNTFVAVQMLQALRSNGR